MKGRWEERQIKREKGKKIGRKKRGEDNNNNNHNDNHNNNHNNNNNKHDINNDYNTSDDEIGASNVQYTRGTFFLFLSCFLFFVLLFFFLILPLFSLPIDSTMHIYKWSCPSVCPSVPCFFFPTPIIAFFYGRKDFK